MVGLPTAHPADQSILLLGGQRGEAELTERLQTEPEQLHDRRQTWRAVAAADRVVRVRVHEPGEVDRVRHARQQASEKRT